MGEGDDQSSSSQALFLRVQAIAAAHTMDTAMQLVPVTAMVYPTQKILGKVFSYQGCLAELQRQERNGATWSRYFTAACKDNGQGPACLVCKLCGKELSCINPSDTLKTHPNSSACRRTNSPDEDRLAGRNNSVNSSDMQTQEQPRDHDMLLLEGGQPGRRAVTSKRLLAKDLLQPTSRGKAFLDALHACANNRLQEVDARIDGWNEDATQYTTHQVDSGFVAKNSGSMLEDLKRAAAIAFNTHNNPSNDSAPGSSDNNAGGSGGLGAVPGTGTQDGDGPAAKRVRGDLPDRGGLPDAMTRSGNRTVLNLATPQKTDDEDVEGEPGPMGEDGLDDDAGPSGIDIAGSWPPVSFRGRGRGRRGGGAGLLAASLRAAATRGWPTTGVRGRGRGTRGGGRWGARARARAALEEGIAGPEGSPVSVDGTGVMPSPVAGVVQHHSNPGGMGNAVLTRGAAAAAAAANGGIPTSHAHGHRDGVGQDVLGARGQASMAAMASAVGMANAKVVQSHNQNCHLLLGAEDHVGAAVAPILAKMVQHLVEDSMFGNENSFNKLLQLCRVLPMGMKQSIMPGSDDAAAMLGALSGDGAAGPSGAGGHGVMEDPAVAAAAAGAAAGAGNGELGMDHADVINVNVME